MKASPIVHIATVALLATTIASGAMASAQDNRKFDFVLEGVAVNGQRPTDVLTQRLDLREVGHLRVGESRNLRASLGHQSDEPIHPATRYRVVSGGDRLAIVSTNEKHGEVVIEGRRQGVALLAWEVIEPGLRLPSNSGRLEIRVGPPADTQSSQPVENPQGTTLQANADAVVRGLYRGILLREPDPAGAGYADQIRRSGWLALDSVARTIADSEESRKNVYAQPGVGDPQRLLALHRELLGRSQQDIAMDEWDYQLNLLAARRYADVVSELVHRPEFRQHFGIVAY
jgi:hypothetical protein